MESTSLGFSKLFLQQARLTTAHFYPMPGHVQTSHTSKCFNGLERLLRIVVKWNYSYHPFTIVLRFFPSWSYSINWRCYSSPPISTFVSISIIFTKWERLSFASSVKQIISCSLFSYYSSIISSADNRLTTRSLNRLAVLHLFEGEWEMEVENTCCVILFYYFFYMCFVKLPMPFPFG